MNKKQLKVASEDMKNWLSHPSELGKEPDLMEFAKTFNMDDMTYYIFKYKENHEDENWLLGVAGGYEDKDYENCGHVFSKMEEYHEDKAEEDGREIVEMIKEYWMNQAAKYDHTEDEENWNQTDGGIFVGFPLLSELSWDKEKLIQDLKEDWGIEEVEIEEDEEDEDFEGEEDFEDIEDMLIFNISPDTMIAISMMPGAVPNKEAELNAENNYLWEDALKIAQDHKAHLMVAVMGDAEDKIENAKTFTKILATCCKQEFVSGIYSGGNVFEPDYYMEFAEMIRHDLLPVFNWIYFGFYNTDKGLCAYTYGMEFFGKREMEVLYTQEDPQTLHEFLYDIAYYVLEEDLDLISEESLGFSEDDKHYITLSEGVCLPQMTLKIEY